MKAILFGANGQDGFYLTQLLNKNRVEVVGVSRSGQDGIPTDISDYASVLQLVAQHRPQYIFHLAANSTTRHEAIFENHRTISTGTLNILEAVRSASPQSKVFISGSGLQFKNNSYPIKETDEFEARDPYSVSRIQSVYAARYFRTIGLKVYIGYFFNHDSPKRTERHISRMIADTVKKIAAGEKKTLEIGSLDVMKEWGYAGDIVEGLWTFIRQDTIFEATLGTGKAHSVQEYINECFLYFNMDWKKFVKIKTGFKPEYEILVSDPTTILSLGWKPSTNLKDLAEMMLTPE